MGEVTNLDAEFTITDKNIFDSVNKEKLPQQLKVSLTEIIRAERFISFELDTNFIEATGGNYFGELYVAQIKGNTENGFKRINLFIKSILALSKNLDFISFEKLYAREIFVYSTLSDVLEKLQSDSNVPDNERFKLAKFYETSNKKALVMENLAIKGFKVNERLAIPSLRFCEMAMEQLARFHALSFVMKKNKPEFYEKEIASKQTSVNFNESWLTMVKSVTQNTVKELENDEAKKKVQKYLREVDWLDKFNNYMNTNAEALAVFCHGDYRSQNIMVREKDGVPMEIRPIDYQFCHYGHPVNDIIYFIIGASDQEFRRNHMDHLTSLYHETLKNFLPYFDMQVEEIYPKKQYDQDLKDRLDFAIIIGLFFLNFFYAPEDDPPDLSMNFSTQKLTMSDMCRRCINELVEDFIEWDLL